MTHYFLEGLEYSWRLIRETPNSARFEVNSPDDKQFAVDVHFTAPKILTASICMVGVEGDESKSIMTPLLDDLGKIALRRCDYAVIDYSLSWASRIFTGNFSIDPNARKSHKDI